MATTPNFPNTPRSYTPVLAATAVTVRVNPTTANVAVLAVGAVNGSRIDQIDFNSTLATASAANLLRLWFRPNGGSTWFLLREIALPASLAAGTTTNTANARINLDKSTLETPIKLANGDSLGFSVHVGESVVGAASGWDY